jgi:hypothetical protein
LAAYAAGDSWQNKPSSEWNDKEVRAVLEKSPWAHRENLTLVKPTEAVLPCKRGSVRCVSDDTDQAPVDPFRRHPPTPDDIQNSQDRRAYSAMPPKGDGVAGTAIVRWASAQTVREAMSRAPEKTERIAGNKDEPPPLPPSVAYIVYVDLRVHLNDVKKLPQDGMLTSTMMRSSNLVLKSTGEHIPALRVTSAPLPEFDNRKELALAAFYVYFPRQKDGKPVLPDAEIIVRFECPLSPGPIEADFDLRTMKRAGVPDL